MPLPPVDPSQNRLFRSSDQLPAEYFDRLAARDPEEVRRLSGAFYDPVARAYTFGLLGQQFLIDPAARTITPLEADQGPVDFQSGLVIIMGLLQERDVLPSGQWVTERELPGGDLFFQGPHALPTGLLAKTFGRDQEAFVVAAEAIGGRSVDGPGDAAVRLQATPRLFITLVLWLADEEFKAQVKVLFDPASAEALPLDVLWALIFVVSRRLVPRQNSGEALPDTGACGVNCAACLLSVRGACTPCGAGTSDRAQDKLAAQLRLLGAECAILACAASKNVAHCPRDCTEFPCDRFEGYPFSHCFLDMQRRRRAGLSQPS